GVRPIICCGESLDQREEGVHFDFIKSQIIGAFKDIPAEKLYLITIAYEPIWAIGTGKTATDEQAEEICAFIRDVIAELYSEEVAQALRIQYGGSVNAKNVAGLFGMENIDGGLVGGASLKTEDFGIICNTYQG
ncbi:MAG TPA: triosephosphate isomerase, partial [Clostridiaceae bacterium]|nr:triosephosphate isomerase [Clostridiaceae bacterium]